MKIAILGGTGSEGFGLGYRWAAAGHEIIIGSRSAERAQSAADEMLAQLPKTAVSGTDNATAAGQADLVVLSVPYSAQAPTLEGVKDQLTDKIILTVVAPTGEKKSRVSLLPSGKSAAEEAQEQVGDTARVVAAFQNIGAHHLTDLEHQMNCDVLVFGAKKDDKATVIQLCEDAGMRGVNAGALQNAIIAEGLTSVLIAINIIYKKKSAGIQITGLDE